MADLVNLNRFRKARAKADREKTAEANRIKHGTPKVLRKASETEKSQAERNLAGHKLEKDGGDN